jgi:hypothetical protein
MTTMEHNQITNYLKLLSLHRISEIYLQEAENAANTKLSYQDYLLRLLEQQVLSKIERSINRKIQLAAFPQLKRLEEFDFSYQPKINEHLIGAGVVWRLLLRRLARQKEPYTLPFSPSFLKFMHQPTVYHLTINTHLSERNVSWRQSTS